MTIGWAVLVGCYSLAATTISTRDNGTPRSRSGSVGLPVGAVDLPVSRIHDFRGILQSALSDDDDPLRFRGLDKNTTHARIHLPTAAAALLDDPDHPQSNTVRQYLETHGGIYRPGVRRRCPTHHLELSSSDTITGSDDDPRFRFVELFAGIGGFRCGLEEIGGTCVLANEINPTAAKIYQQQTFDGHDDDVLAVGDVLDVDPQNIPPYDVLVGGFPCQSFSFRGAQRGLDDDRGRGEWYREVARILHATQPSGFLLENVPGLVTLGTGGSRTVRQRGSLPEYRTGSVLQTILETLEDCGYDVDWQVLNSRKWLPQMRERVYIVGTRTDLQCPPLNWNNLLLHDLKNESSTTLRDILGPSASPAVAAAALTPAQYQRLLARQHPHYDPQRPPRLKNLLQLDGKAPTLIASYHSWSSISTKFIMEEADGTPRSIPRFLTPRECTRLMGFPESFIVPDRLVDGTTDQDIARYYEAIGNAVGPPVVAAVGAELLKSVETARRRSWGPN